MSQPSTKDTYDEALEYIAEELAAYFKDDPEKAVLWIMTPNPLLGDVVPAWLMLSHPNGPEKVMRFVRDCREGNIA